MKVIIISAALLLACSSSLAQYRYNPIMLDGACLFCEESGFAAKDLIPKNRAKIIEKKIGNLINVDEKICYNVDVYGNEIGRAHQMFIDKYSFKQKADTVTFHYYLLEDDGNGTVNWYFRLDNFSIIDSNFTDKISPLGSDEDQQAILERSQFIRRYYIQNVATPQQYPQYKNRRMGRK